MSLLRTFLLLALAALLPACTPIDRSLEEEEELEPVAPAVDSVAEPTRPAPPRRHDRPAPPGRRRGPRGNEPRAPAPAIPGPPAPPAETSAFKPVGVGDKIELVLTGGAKKEGRITALDPEGVSLQLSVGEVTFHRTSLSAETRAALYEEDYVRLQAALKARAEELARRRSEALERQRAEAARRAAEQQKAGEFVFLEPAPAPFSPPRNRADGVVPEVDAYLSRTLRNHASTVYLEWSKVQDHAKGYVVTCHYRTDGGSLGPVEEHKVFYLNKGGQVYRASHVREYVPE